MNVLITGGAGFLGRRLAMTLLQADLALDVPPRAIEGGSPKSEQSNIQKLILFDRYPPDPSLPSDPRLEVVQGDITQPQVVQDLITEEIDVIIHLAAIVSGEAEENFDLGQQVNVEATQAILEACRQRKTCPRLLFPSSVAVFGGDMPTIIEDNTAPTPQSSYGTQKAICELLLNDYSRRGLVDGRVVRLPTIVVRPGKPNKATSTFASSIIREPLQGQSAICPVGPDLSLWIMSPRMAVQNLIHALKLPAEVWEKNRVVSLPGLTVSVKEMVDGLTEIAGEEVTKRIRWERDPFIEKIVGSWPARFAPQRGLTLGFQADSSIQAIIQAFIEEDLSRR